MEGFNPRLRTGGDDYVGAYYDDWQMVSIHASAREATASGAASSPRISSFNPRLRTGGDPNGAGPPWPKDVSIHASAREATTISDFAFSALTFQSTPPHGRRQFIAFHARLCPIVSIHASAREATPTLRPEVLRPRRFNPRLRTGGDRPTPTTHQVHLTVSIHASAREAT